MRPDSSVRDGQSFPIEIDGRIVGMVARTDAGEWRSFGPGGRQIGDHARPAEAAQAVRDAYSTPRARRPAHMATWRQYR